MQCPPTSPSPTETGNEPSWTSDPEIEARETWNVFLLATHQVVLRIGWLFKTESVIMPAFLDYVAGPGAGWLRGCLPVLNRLGQSVPPIFCARLLQAMRRKKRALAAFTILMSLPFGALSIVWLRLGGQPRSWLAAVFLALYFAFFVANGLYHLSFGTVQGKLVRPTRRGNLILLSTFWGTLPALLIAWWLLDDWLARPDYGFGYLFAFTAVAFLVSGLTALLLREPRDRNAIGFESRGNVRETLHVLGRDGNLRLVVLVGILFGSALMISPHYQALARERLGLTGPHWMVWVIVQSAAVGIYSLFVGPLADVRGNRLTLRLLIFGSAIAPAFAVALVRLPKDLGESLFWMVYIPLGITPLVYRILLNYALEICEPDEHPRYLSIVSLGVALPFVVSPLVGRLVDLTGFERVFAATILLLLASGALTFRLSEPRHRVRGDEARAVVGDSE